MTYPYTDYIVSSAYAEDGVLLELQCEPPVHQANEILTPPWNRGKGCGRLSMLCRAELATLLLWPESDSCDLFSENPIAVGPFAF